MANGERCGETEKTRREHFCLVNEDKSLKGQSPWMAGSIP